MLVTAVSTSTPFDYLGEGDADLKLMAQVCQSSVTDSLEKCFKTVNNLDKLTLILFRVSRFERAFKDL
jgi:hypothetical protein